jgi:5S rRNA maturation endonuclease (ribonuclease M5)
MSSKKKKIGFIVEGDFDKEVIDTLAARLLGDRFHTHTIRLGGKAALPWVWSTVLDLQARDYSHVIILFDADTSIESEVERQRREVEMDLRQHSAARNTSLCIATPTIEAWLLANEPTQPGDRSDPKGALQRRLRRPLQPGDGARLAEELDIEQARKNSRSFEQFFQALHALTKRPESTSHRSL